MIKTVIFFSLMICPKFTRLSDVSDLPANTVLTHTLTINERKIKSQAQDEYIFKFIRLTASKCNSCVIDNKNYAVKIAKD